MEKDEPEACRLGTYPVIVGTSLAKGRKCSPHHHSSCRLRQDVEHLLPGVESIGEVERAVLQVQSVVVLQ